jgi:hypothetical protein
MVMFDRSSHLCTLTVAHERAVSPNTHLSNPHDCGRTDASLLVMTATTPPKAPLPLLLPKLEPLSPGSDEEALLSSSGGHADGTGGVAPPVSDAFLGDDTDFLGIDEADMTDLLSSFS